MGRKEPKYIVCTLLFVALFVTHAKKVQGLTGTNFIIFSTENRYF